MGFLTDFFDKVKLNSDEEDDYNEFEGTDEYDEEEVVEEEESAAAKTPLKKKSEETSKKTSKTSASTGSGAKVFSMNGELDTRNKEVRMILLKNFEMSLEIADHLLEGRTIVLNMEGLQMDVAQRIIDFVSGSCYTMGGKLERVSKKICIATPNGVSLSGDFSELTRDQDDVKFN